MIFFDYDSNNCEPWGTKRPFIPLTVTFWQRPKEIFTWPALLDTGSTCITLPGKYRFSENFNIGDIVSVSLFSFMQPRGKTSVDLDLQVVGPCKGFQSCGFKFIRHPFEASLEIDGFGVLNWKRIFFTELRYAIIGSPIILANQEVCFRKCTIPALGFH